MTTAAELAEWTSGHDTASVLLPGLLQRGHFKILAKRDGRGIVAGAIARLGSGVVDVSNVHSLPGHTIDWAELASAVNGHFPGVHWSATSAATTSPQRSMAGSPVGDLRVWVR